MRNRSFIRKISLTLIALLAMHYGIRLVYAALSVGSSTQVTVDTTGQAPAGGSGSPVYCPNADIISFRSTAGDLVSNDQHAGNDVFVRDAAGTLSIQSITSTGLAANGDSTNPSISMVDTKGFYALAFSSAATNLGFLSDTNNSDDIFFRLPTRNITEIVSKGLNTSIPNGRSYAPSIAYIPSTNKVRIAFASAASNLVSGDANGVVDVFLAEFTPPTATGYDAANLVTIRRISISQSGTQGDAISDNPKISANGQFVVFGSRATNLVSGPLSNQRQIYLYNVETGSLSRISQTSAGVPGDNDSTNVSISYNGRYVSYITGSQNIISVNDAQTRAVLYDSNDGTSTAIDETFAGVKGDGNVQDVAISSSGRFVTFSDDATNLVPNDTNGLADIFIKDMLTGEISRMSNSVTVGETDGASDLVVTGSTFNDLNSSFLFRSFATNVALNDHPSGAGDLYKASATLDPPPLSRGTELEVPPDIVLKKRRLTINMQKFTASQSPSPRASSSIEYEIRIQPKAKSSDDRRKIISKKNKSTARKVKPGTYTVKYRAKQKSGSSTVSKTPFSPAITFTVG